MFYFILHSGNKRILSPCAPLTAAFFCYFMLLKNNSKPLYYNAGGYNGALLGLRVSWSLYHVEIVWAEMEKYICTIQISGSIKTFVMQILKVIVN